jgi:hypothetical protein
MSKNTPVLCARPSRLWQCAQLVSMKPRARSSLSISAALICASRPGSEAGMFAASPGTLKRGIRCTLVATWLPFTLSAGAPLSIPDATQCWSWFSAPLP